MLINPTSSVWHSSQRRLNLLAACLLACLMAANVSAEDAGAPEYRIKAAMVFKFLSYTQWPDSAFEANEAPYRIWVLGSSPISDELTSVILGRSANERSVTLNQAATLEDVVRPHVLFVARDAERYLSDIAEKTASQAILVITENQDRIQLGSTINLRLTGGRIGFDVSLENAAKSNLKLSSRLLSVASSVEREKP